MNKEAKLTTVSSQRSGLHWLWLSVAIIVLDQLIKRLIMLYFAYNEAYPLGAFVNLTLEHNTGAAFSFLSDVGSLATAFFIGTAVIISIALCIALYRLSPKQKWLGVGLSLIIGGAIGNLLDRIQYGYVIDFVHLHIQFWSLPIFNLADVAITTGAIMLIIDIFRKKTP